MSGQMNVLILGLGSAGCKFLDTCIQQEEPLPPHLAVHTDAQMLNSCGAENKILLGSSILHGGSTGGNLDLGRQSVEADREKLGEYFSDIDILFLVTGLGGGTGTGAAPPVASLAREYGATVLCFAIQPFFFEGRDKRRQAEVGLKELRDASDAVIRLSNQTICNWANDDITVQDAFERLNVALLRNLLATVDLLACPGVVTNVRFSDFAALIDHSNGICVMGYGEGEGENRIEDAINAVISNPVLGKENIIKKASGLIIGILGGTDMTVMEVRKIMETIPEMARSDVHLHMGAVLRPNWHKRIGIALFASEKWEEPPFETVVDEDTKSEKKPHQNESQGKTKTPKQSELTLQPKGRGCFNGIEPTYFEGEDLDTPAFQRKNIKLTT